MTSSEAGEGFAPVDVITQNPGDLARREQMRDLGAGIVQAVFRVVKLGTLHAMDNQAMVRQIAETATLVNDYGLRTGTNPSILFAHGSIFVGGQLLRASRAIYDGATELGAVLLRCGIAELTIAKDARKLDIQTLAQVISAASRGQRPKNFERPTPSLRLRAASDAALGRGLAVERLTQEQAVVRTYASAVVIMRRFYESLAGGVYYLPQRVKRVAQSLVDLSAGETPAFLGVTSARNGNHDDAGRAVNTAILSLAIARQITGDALLLVRLAMAALLYDTARSRLAGGRPGFAVLPQLSEQQELDEPAATAVVLTALGRVNEPSVVRTVMVYEAHWVKRQARLGALYDGLRQPTIQARIIAAARSFNDLLTPAPGATVVSADEAIATLEAQAVEAIERTVLRLLVGALGIFPTGTLVELSTGEVVMVVATPSHPARYSQPRVRMVFDAAGGVADRSVEIDLAAAPLEGAPRRHIVRVVAMADEAAPELRALAKQATKLASDTNRDRTPSSPSIEISPSSSGPRSVGLTGLRSLTAPAGTPAPTPPPTQARVFPATLPSPRHPTPPPWRAAISIEKPQEIELYEANDGAHDPGHDPGQSKPGVAYDGTRSKAPERAYAVERVSPLPEPPPSDRAPRSSPASVGTAIGAATKTMTPTAEGNLTRTPLVHLLVYLLDQGLTGSAVFQTPEGVKHCVYFQNGIPAKIHTGSVIAPLDRVILDMGLLDEATLRRTTVEVSKKKVLHGKLLVTEGLLTQAVLLDIIAEQLVRKLVALFSLAPATGYAFFQDTNLLATYGGAELTPCSPLAAIMAGVRTHARAPVVDATLDRFAARPLVLHVEADPRRFDLQSRERAVVDMLRTKRMTLAELLAAGVAEERVVRLTIYALAISRHLDLGSGKPPIGISTPFVPPRSMSPSSPRVAMPPAATTMPSPSPDLPVDAPPPSQGRRTGFGIGFGQPARPADASAPLAAPRAARSPEPAPIAPAVAPAGPSNDTATATRRAEIEKRHRVLDRANLYEILGVPEDAKSDQIQAAYFALAKAWHPDRLPAELADMRPQLTRVFGKMSEAFQTLSDTEKRRDYEASRKGGSGSTEEQQTIERVVDAALAFQKAEVLFRKHDAAGAEALARAAVGADPDQPEYLALLVWIQAQRRGDPPPASEDAPTTFYDDLIAKLDVVLEKEPQYERARFYRGMLLKRSGRTERAIRDFRVAAEVNPKNIDAVREVRLFDMRRKAEPQQTSKAAPGGKPPPGGSPGLFGKLFKK